MPEAIERPPRPNDTAADLRSLVTLGREDPPPTPAPAAPAPSPGPPSDAADEAVLHAALLDAGISATADDQAAVKALAGLDTATVQAVARWMKTKKPEK